MQYRYPITLLLCSARGALVREYSCRADMVLNNSVSEGIDHHAIATKSPNLFSPLPSCPVFVLTGDARFHEFLGSHLPDCRANVLLTLTITLVH